MLVKLFRMFGIHKKSHKTVAKYEKMISSYKTEDSKLICNHGNWQGKLEYAPKEQYGAGIEATFEDIKVVVPEKFDEYFTQKYGDWRADLPSEKKVSHHMPMICDTENPYTEYKNQR